MSERERIKEEILEALHHPEAEEGLYFRNLCHLHEEDERRPVIGEQEDILAALSELIQQGVVVTEDNGEELIFKLQN